MVIVIVTNLCVMRKVQRKETLCATLADFIREIHFNQGHCIVQSPQEIPKISQTLHLKGIEFGLILKHATYLQMKKSQ